MKNEKIIFSLLLFIICIFSIFVVSAAEGSGDNLIGEDSNENIILETNLEELMYPSIIVFRISLMRMF